MPGQKLFLGTSQSLAPEVVYSGSTELRAERESWSWRQVVTAVRSQPDFSSQKHTMLAEASQSLVFHLVLQKQMQGGEQLRIPTTSRARQWETPEGALSWACYRGCRGQSLVKAESFCRRVLCQRPRTARGSRRWRGAHCSSPSRVPAVFCRWGRARGREAMRQETEAQLPKGGVFADRLFDASAFFQNPFHQERLRKGKSNFLEHRRWKRPCSSQMETVLH